MKIGFILPPFFLIYKKGAPVFLICQPISVTLLLALKNVVLLSPTYTKLLIVTTAPQSLSIQNLKLQTTTKRRYAVAIYLYVFNMLTM